jgi:battenin
VLLIACAKSISDGGTGLIFLSNSLPSLLVKLSAPYWFDRVSYRARIMAASALMAIAFMFVAMFSSSHHSNFGMAMQLIGCAFASVQCGLGESSLLALAGKCDAGREKKACLTAFSSGTGLAGIFGFLWKFVWNDVLGLSLSSTLFLANSLALLYGGVYYKCLWGINVGTVAPIQSGDSTDDQSNYAKSNGEIIPTVPTNQDTGDLDYQEVLSTEEGIPQPPASTLTRIEDMSTTQRLRAVLALWPYMIPLYVVYFAEYALQAGTWTAIGFPVDDEDARDRFYEYSNWTYQAGVFISRSSGTLFTAPLSILWLMPALQIGNVAFFWWVAKYQVFYNNLLLIPAFYVGLLGGAVYINGYTRISADIPIEHREFALSSTSVAEGLGIVSADVVGLFLQSCLYQIHDIKGAVVSCPF